MNQIIKGSMAPKGYKNAELLESLAEVFEGKFWGIPGLSGIYAPDGKAWRIRSDLGHEFKAWASKDLPMTNNGVSLELDLSTDNHKVRQWTDHFNAKALRRKFTQLKQIKTL